MANGDDPNDTKWGGDYASDQPKEDPYKTDWGGKYASDERGNGVYKTRGDEPSDTSGEPASKDLAKRGTPGKDDLGTAEKNGAGSDGLGQETEEARSSPAAGAAGTTSDSFYKPTRLGLTKNQQRFIYRNRKSMLGGGVVATILGLVLFFTVASGPLQFLEFGKLLEQFHLTSQSNTQDNRFLKEVRFFRYASQGEIEKTRLGFLGNKVASSFETKLNASGYVSAYSPRFGSFDGFVVDQSNEKFKGKSFDEVKQIVKDETGADLVDWDKLPSNNTLKRNPDLKGQWIIDLSKNGSVKSYAANYRFTFAMLKNADVNGLASAIGARLLGVKAAFSFNPLTKLTGKFTTANEKKAAAKKQDTAERTKEISAGDNINASASANPTDPNNQDQATKAQGQANQEASIINEGESALKAAENGDPEAISAANSSFFKGGALALASAPYIACYAKSLDDKGSVIKQDEARVPAIRAGLRAVSIASKIRDGKQIDGGILAADAAQLHGTVTLNNGKTQNTSWIDAQSIQANLGHPNTGVAPSSTLQNLSSNVTPFHFLNQEPIATPLGGFCSNVGQALSVVVGFFGGFDLAQAVLGSIVTQFGNAAVQLEFTRWAAKQAVDPNAIGADHGSVADYGLAFASSDIGATSGGRPLTTKEASAVNNFNSSQYQSTYQSQSIAYKLFDATDPRTALGGLISHTSSSAPHNVASLAGGFINIVHSFGSIFNVFSKPALAASNGGYNYGFPQVGFSQDELTNPDYENPYENACYVVGCGDKGINGFLSSSGTQITVGQDYVDAAKKCFGVTVAPDASGRWDVTAEANADISTDSNAGFDVSNLPADCSGTPSGLDPANWTRLRFFVLDTETMNSMACYASDGSNPDIDQACTDIGFTGAQTNNFGNNNGPIEQGTDAQLAQKLLGYKQTGQYNCDNPGDCTDLQYLVDGKPLSSEPNTACKADQLDTRVLQTLLYLIEQGNYKIGTYAMCGDHGFDSPRGHSGGFAVDIDSINGVFVNNDTPEAKSNTLSLDQFLNKLPVQLQINQLISYGYGNHPDADLEALQLFNSKPCNSQCVADYTLATEQQHENHVHVGF